MTAFLLLLRCSFFLRVQQWWPENSELCLQRDPETKPAISRIGSSKKVNSGFLSWNPFVTEISSGTMSLLLLTSRPLQFIQVRPLQQSEFSWLKRASKEVDSTSTIFISWKITFDFHFRFWPYWLIEYISCHQISFSFRDSAFLHPLSGIYISAGDYIIRVNDVTDDITAFMEVSIGFCDDLKYDFFFVRRLSWFVHCFLGD